MSPPFVGCLVLIENHYLLLSELSEWSEVRVASEGKTSGSHLTIQQLLTRQWKGDGLGQEGHEGQILQFNNGTVETACPALKKKHGAARLVHSRTSSILLFRLYESGLGHPIWEGSPFPRRSGSSRKPKF